MKTEGTVDLSEKELTKHILVTISHLKANTDGNVASFRVNIHDKLSKMTEILQEDGISGCLIYNGKLIKEPSETTFAKQFVLNNHKFAIATGNDQYKDPIKWIRFPDFYLTDYYYMNTVHYDAVVFVPKVDIVFFGYGIFANYNGADMKYKVQWQIGKEGEKSEEYEIDCPDGDKDPEKKWHTHD